MRPRTSLRLGLFAGSLALLSLLATRFATAHPQQGDRPWQRGQGEHEGRGRREETKLSHLMHDVEDSLEKLGGSLAATDGQVANVAEVSRLERVVLDAKDEIPPLVAQIQDPEERAERTAQFRLKMQDLERAMLDLEAALLKQDPEAAQKVLDSMDAIERSGHNEFRPRRERGGPRPGGPEHDGPRRDGPPPKDGGR